MTQAVLLRDYFKNDLESLQPPALTPSLIVHTSPQGNTFPASKDLGVKEFRRAVEKFPLLLTAPIRIIEDPSELEVPLRLVTRNVNSCTHLLSHDKLMVKLLPAFSSFVPIFIVFFLGLNF